MYPQVIFCFISRDTDRRNTSVENYLRGEGWSPEEAQRECLFIRFFCLIGNVVMYFVNKMRGHDRESYANQRDEAAQVGY